MPLVVLFYLEISLVELILQLLLLFPPFFLLFADRVLLDGQNLLQFLFVLFLKFFLVTCSQLVQCLLINLRQVNFLLKLFVLSINFVDKKFVFLLKLLESFLQLVIFSFYELHFLLSKSEFLLLI